MIDFLDQIETASSYIKERWDRPPRVGIVLGTGSGQIADSLQIDLKIDYGSIPFFPRSTAIGHQGELVCGSFSGQAVLAMQGRFHLYEGYPYEQVTLPIHVMAKLGIQRLMVSNAAGGVNPRFRKGEIMLIESHLDFMWKTAPSLFAPDMTHGTGRGQRCADSSIDPPLIRLAEEVARKGNFVLHRGVYAGVLGPNYETRAEYRMLRNLGADAVGMSTLPELAVACKYGIDVLACSIITNEANPDELEPTTGEEVVEVAEVAAGNLLEIFREGMNASHATQ